MVEFPRITRVEVIDEVCRQYVNNNVKNVRISLQDDNKTMKIFLINDSLEDKQMAEAIDVVGSMLK